MLHDIPLPDLGEGVTEAFVVQWLVEVGQPVTAGQPIVEVMTDKVNVEVESPADGVLEEQRFAPEARVGIDEVLAVVRSS